MPSGFHYSLRKNKNKTDDVQRSLDRSLQTMSEAMQELNSTVSDWGEEGGGSIELRPFEFPLL